MELHKRKFNNGAEIIEITARKGGGGKCFLETKVGSF